MHILRPLRQRVPCGRHYYGKRPPVWHDGCQQCGRCFNLCPKRAITQFDWIGRGSTRGRYIFKEPKK
ncbi:4Fe-4S binding protein [Elusimicrobium simillimum]|uniref:4Fe-4S binding protein n=1 Tax=Elusimicrobium simillimum TaxID=3143438 RepID=UPI003C6FDA85